MNFKPIADDVLIEGYRTHGTFVAAAKALKVSHKRIREALVRHNIEFPKRGDLMFRVWATARKGEISKSRRGPAFVSAQITNRWEWNAKTRGLAYELSYDDLQELWDRQAGLCYFTGQAMNTAKSTKDVRSRRNDPMQVSLDRLNSDGGYVKGNVALVCWWINRAKWKYGEEEFKALLNAAVMSINRRGVQ